MALESLTVHNNPEDISPNETVMSAVAGAEPAGMTRSKIRENLRRTLTEMQVTRLLQRLSGKKLSEPLLYQDDPGNPRSPYHVTKKGREWLDESKIVRDAGFLGSKWARQLKSEGSSVTFLGDLDERPEHRRYIIALNQEKREVRLAQMLGIVEYSQGRYLGQYVQPETGRAVRASSLDEYLRDRVPDFREQDKVASALKQFFSEHNSFIAQALGADQSLRFAFPAEVGNFACMAFIGIGYQLVWPDVPKMTVILGSVSLPNALGVVEIVCEADLNKAYEATVKGYESQFDASKLEEAQKLWSEAFHVYVRQEGRKLSTEGGSRIELSRGTQDRSTEGPTPPEAKISMAP